MKRIRAVLAACATAGALAFSPTVGAAQGAIEIGTRQVDGLEVTLLSAPPTEMRQPMPGMSGMQGMGGGTQGMGGMRGTGGMMGKGSGMGMPGMGTGGSQTEPTHFLGVVVRDAGQDATVRGLRITLTARKGAWSQTVRLMPMPGSYGAHMTLPEQGRYAITVTIDRPGRPAEATFELDAT